MSEPLLDEAPVLFGSQRDLTGIVTLPSGTSRPVLGCLLFNAGVLHRVGPHRLNVKLARALAQQGVASIRFDLSGLGDSPAQEGIGGREQVLVDMRAAADCLHARLGIERFIVVGVCSGAVNGYWFAQADRRVIGLLMFDGFTYPTRKTHLLRRWLRLRSMSWPVLLKRLPAAVRRVFVPAPARPAGLFDVDGMPGNPPRQEFRRVMDSLIVRGTSVYLLYSGSFIEHHNYDAQLRDAFRGAAFLEAVRYAYLPGVDHTLTSLAAQHSLCEAACAWAASLRNP